MAEMVPEPKTHPIHEMQMLMRHEKRSPQTGSKRLQQWISQRAEAAVIIA